VTHSNKSRRHLVHTFSFSTTSQRTLRALQFKQARVERFLFRSDLEGSRLSTGLICRGDSITAIMIRCSRICKVVEKTYYRPPHGVLPVLPHNPAKYNTQGFSVNPGHETIALLLVPSSCVRGKGTFVEVGEWWQRKRRKCVGYRLPIWVNKCLGKNDGRRQLPESHCR
jgi:hypothetical protein